jgi:7,8-dihydro-6-hydroxymethylpterin-pyrophosphokinase
VFSFLLLNSLLLERAKEAIYADVDFTWQLKFQNLVVLAETLEAKQMGLVLVVVQYEQNMNRTL